MHCPHCGQQLGPDAFFCGSCGGAVQAAPSFRPAPVAAPVTTPVVVPAVVPAVAPAVAAPASGGYGPYGASASDPYAHVSQSRSDMHRHRSQSALSPTGGRTFYLLALAVLLGVAGLYGIMSVLAGHLAGAPSSGSVCDSSAYGSGSGCVDSVKLLLLVWVFWACAVLGCVGGVGASSPRAASKIAGRLAQLDAIAAFLLGTFAIMSPASVLGHRGSTWMMVSAIILGYAGATCSWLLSEGDDIEVSQLTEWVIWATSGAVGLLTLSLIWDVHRSIYQQYTTGGFGTFLSGAGAVGGTLAGVLLIVAFFGFVISFVLVRLDRASAS